MKRGATIAYVYENDETTENTSEVNQPVSKNEKLFNPDENLKLPAGMIYVSQI